MPSSYGAPRSQPVTTDERQQLSKLALSKGIGNSDFGAMHEIRVVVSPSLICKAYSEELYDAMIQTLIINTGNVSVILPFTQSDLFVYLTILARERVKDVRKQRTLFRPSDQDIKVPHFFYAVLQALGDVVSEERHVWLKADFSSTDLLKIQSQYRSCYIEEIDKETGRSILVEDVEAMKRWKSEFHVYEGEGEHEREFVFNMSRHLKMLERVGFVNGMGLPRGETGELAFMLFAWIEGKLQHPDPEVEPGTAMLASLLAFERSVSLLNPYISYGPANAYRVLLKEVTSPRGLSNPRDNGTDQPKAKPRN